MFENDSAAIDAMMNLSESNEEEIATNVPPTTEETPVVENTVNGEQMNIMDAVTTDVPAQTPTDNTIGESDRISVSDVILQNGDKYIKMIVTNDKIREVSSDADLTNYIVYVNTDKKIPCLYDCERLYVPTNSVKNADGTWNIVSIEGRRSGFIVKCNGRDLVMSKNFIYDCTLDANGNITSVKEYNRKQKIEDVTQNVITDYDSACLIIQKFLPKIIKSGKYTTIDALKEQVKLAYDSVNDINAMMNIINLRLMLGC